MSCNYADGLSPYENKGKCGMPERFDAADQVELKVRQLADMMESSSHVVVHTGAGVSTAAGIPDFRGPRGVWTLQGRGLPPDAGVAWQRALPTVTHMALVALAGAGRVRCVVSQNIDGLHLRSGLARRQLAELHGNVFTHRCAACGRQFVRRQPVPSVGERCLQLPCPGGARPCRGQLHDVVLDWEAALPERDLQLAEMHSTAADLSICLGSTLQIVPSGNLPVGCQRAGGRLVICNLQPTKHDRKADLIINAYVDDVMKLLMKRLGVEVPDYLQQDDPTCRLGEGEVLEWTLPEDALKDASLVAAVREAKLKARQIRQQMKRAKPPLNGSHKNKSLKTEGGDVQLTNGVVEPPAIKCEANNEVSESDSEVVSDVGLARAAAVSKTQCVPSGLTASTVAVCEDSVS